MARRNGQNSQRADDDRADGVADETIGATLEDPTDDDDLLDDEQDDGRAADDGNTADDVDDVDEDDLDGGADEVDEEDDEDGNGQDAADDDERGAASHVLTREFAISVDRERLATRAEGDDRIPISFSSEQPVFRSNWWEDEDYHEVLDHTPESVNMDYARNGLSFLIEHNRGDQVGIVEDVTFGADKKGRGMLKLSKSARGREIAQDVTDGIRRFVSFGYTTGNQFTQSGGDGEGTAPTRRYTQWTPMEVSSVSIPADTTVGIGRSAPHDQRYRRPNHRPAPQAREFPVRNGQGAAASGAANGNTGNGNNSNTRNGGDSRQPRERDFHAEMIEIRTMCREAKVEETTLDDFLKRKLSPNQVKQALFDTMVAQSRSLADVPQEEQLGLSPKDRREYSFGRALQALVTGNWKNAGYERSVSDTLAKQLGRETTGILVPTGFQAPPDVQRALLELMQKRTTLSGGVAASGGNLVPAQMASTLIELLRNKSVIDKMNPMRLPGLVGTVPVPRQSAAGTAVMSAELPGADVAEGNMTFDQVLLTPKNILGTQSYSKQLFAQTPFAIDALVREDLTEILALLYDVQAMHGDGTGNNLTGIYAQAGVAAIAMGGTITYAQVVAMESAIEAANANVGQMGYVTTPEIKGKAKQKLEFAVNGSSKLWSGTADQGEMNGYRAFASNQVSKTLGAGAEHGIMFGAWGQAIVADWGAIDITVDPYSRARQAIVNITAHWLADFQLRHGPAFAKGTGLTNT